MLNNLCYKKVGIFKNNNISTYTFKCILVGIFNNRTKSINKNKHETLSLTAFIRGLNKKPNLGRSTWHWMCQFLLCACFGLGVLLVMHPCHLGISRRMGCCFVRTTTGQDMVNLVRAVVRYVLLFWHPKSEKYLTSIVTMSVYSILVLKDS